ncbi:MAG: MFS transporter [Pseudomonadota bacterium]
MTTGTASPKNNVLRLAASQALMLSAIVMSMAVAGIVGAQLAPDAGLATLPIAAMVVGVAIASLPAGLLMRRVGRRAGFLFGATLGVGASLLSAHALQAQSFALFVLGHLLLGAYQGFANYYRFAAVEATGPEQAGKAISLVVAAGIVAAFLGPQIGQWGRDLFPAQLFVGAYLIQAALSVAALFLLLGLRLPAVAIVQKGEARPLGEIVRQPALIMSIFGASVGYSAMIMAMTATPLAMLGCGLPGSSVTPVIQWHVVGMFAPSFFTGNLIKRFGAPRIMQAGFVLLLAHVAVAVSGLEFLHFLSALVLLGLGWNFAFIGGTTLLTQTYRPAEQLRVQMVNEFIVFGLVATASLSAGWLYARFGWVLLNLSMVPLLVVALLAAARMARANRPVPCPA